MARADRRRVRSAKAHAGCTHPPRDSDLAAIEDTLFFTRIRSHAKWVFVFLALSFLRRLRGLQRRRLGKRRRHRRAPSRRRRRDEREHLRLRRARAGAEEPEERAGAAEPRDRARDRRPDRRGDRRAHALPRAQAEGSGRAARARRPPPRARAASSPRRRRSPSCGPAIRPSARRSARRSTSATAPTIGTGPDRRGDRDPGQPGRSARPTPRPKRRSRARSRRTRGSSCSRRRIPTSSSSSPRRRSRAATTPTAIAAYQKFLKLAPDDPSAGIVKQQIAQLKARQAAPARRVRLTALPETEPASCTQTAGAHIR